MKVQEGKRNNIKQCDGERGREMRGERLIERSSLTESESVCVCDGKCVCVCVRERESE